MIHSPAPAPPGVRPGTASAARSRPRSHQRAFRHEALLYRGAEELVERIVPFLVDGIDAGEPTLVVVDAAKVAMLRDALGDDGDAVEFADMAEVGRNPARIIPAWHDFVRRHAGSGRPLRGVGEPAWPGRSPAEADECERHELLLNVAFGDGPPWWLLCPYDAAALDRRVLDGVARTHPFVTRAGGRARPTGLGAPTADDVFGGELPEPPADADERTFATGPLFAVRALVGARAAAFGFGRERRDDLVLAVNEIASNSVRHAGGSGRLRVWSEGDRLVCEVSDEGRISEPLIGRRPPGAEQNGGRGVWIANQLCDLVQVRSSSAGTVVRLHMTLP